MKTTTKDFNVRTLQTLKHELNRLEWDFGTQLNQILTKEENVALKRALASAWITLDDKVN